jgi:hypothetical protein
MMIAGALLLLQVVTATSNPLGTGNDLIISCSSPVREMQGLCTAYILGVGDGADMQRAMADVIGDKPYCVYQMRKDVTASQMREVVIRYLQEHPATRSQMGSKLIISAFARAYPCPNTGEKPAAR